MIFILNLNTVYLIGLNSILVNGIESLLIKFIEWKDRSLSESFNEINDFSC